VSGFLAAMLGYDRAKMLVFVVLPLLRAFLKNTDVAHHSLGITGGAVGRLRNCDDHAPMESFGVHLKMS